MGILFSSPFWFLFALLIHIGDGGSVFYTQERVGKNGKIFKVMKFRTMTEDKKIQTVLGKFLRVTAMDELPQLINILKGDMSFIGPRPLIKEEMAEMKQNEILKERLEITPGLTGIAQILLPKNASLKEKFLYDIWYKRKRNCIMDIKIILLSYLITLCGRWEVNCTKFHFLHTLKAKIAKELA
jgi:lipopolysaccharide/colanic/teichoic acid biosynthesis glycosyltransferase